MRDAPVLVLTCEHAGNEVPPEYAHAFEDAGGALASHRGWDIGALDVALTLAGRLAAPLLLSRVTRLLVDLNRSLDHPQLFSEFGRRLDEDARRRAIESHYRPYRAGLERLIGDLVGAGRRVMHVGVHTFVDVLDGAPRDLDVGLLYDPARAIEARAVDAWEAALSSAGSALRVRRNEPYRGVDDGLTTHLRTVFPEGTYAGLELEIRQGLLSDGAGSEGVAGVVAEALGPAVRSAGTPGRAGC